MHVRESLEDSPAFVLGPHHEGVHGSLDVARGGGAAGLGENPYPRGRQGPYRMRASVTERQPKIRDYIVHRGEEGLLLWLLLESGSGRGSPSESLLRWSSLDRRAWPSSLCAVCGSLTL